MVMHGKREVSDLMFIEPSTARRYPVTESPYEGVEYVWNHQNFWVCMQVRGGAFEAGGMLSAGRGWGAGGGKGNEVVMMHRQALSCGMRC